MNQHKLVRYFLSMILFLLKTNQYNRNTIGKKRAKAKELKNIIVFC